MATGNPWYSAAETTLPQYVPLPFQELMLAGQAIQNRYDTNMAAMDSTAQGIASIETRLPGHQQYIADYANRFQEETEELLSRYNNNAADPQFAREFTRLRSRYANDPNLRTILNANAAYDANQEIRKKLMESGNRYIDTTRGATGLNPDGTLSADVGTIRATNFESDLHDMYQDTLKATINDFGGRISNEQAVGMVTESLLSEGANNPILREAMEYYMSQGATPEQAQEQLLNTLQREAASALTIASDGSFFSNQLGWANYGLARQKFNFEQAKHFDQLGSVGNLVSVNPASIQNITDMKKVVNKELDDIRKSIDPSTGELVASTPQDYFEDTPENREYLNRTGGFTEEFTRGAFGASGQRYLKPRTGSQGIQARQEALEEKVEFMRNELGLGTDVSINEVLDQYQDFANKNAFVPKSIKFTPTGTSKAIAEAHGSDLAGAVLLEGKNYVRINPDKFDLSGAKDDLRLAEIITTEVPGLEGSGAVAKYTRTIDGKQRTYFKPVPQEFVEIMPITLLGSQAQSSGMSNQELLDPNNGFMRLTKDANGNIVSGVAPQIGPTGVRFAEIDPETLTPIRNQNGSLKFLSDRQMSERERYEQSLLSEYSTQAYRSTVKQD